MRNGFTPPTHGVGSLAWPGSNDQCPGALLGTHCDGPNRPSPCLAPIIACAAAVPAAIPMFLNGVSGIAFVAASYCDASVVSRAALLGNVMLWGTVSTMFFSTRYAAVATAASSDAVFPKRLFSRYGR